MGSQLKIYHDENYIRGVYRIPTADGDLILCSQIPLAPIRRMLTREFMSRNRDSLGMGAVNVQMADIVKTGERIARDLAIKKAAKQINAVVNTPAGQSVVAGAMHEIPGLRISVDAARAGFNLICRARRGDEDAQDQLVCLAKLARSGDGPAQVAADALRKMNSVIAQNGQAGEAEISGWLWNVPYRSVMQHKLSVNPGDAFRKIYNQGH